MSSEFVEAVVDSVRISLTNAQRIIMLKQVDAERYLPIWIGPYEAESITIALQEIEVSRPQTHDLIRNILTAMDARLSRIEIISLKEDVYYGRLVIEAPEKTLQVDARPSDAIALAVRYHAPIQVVAAILEKAGIHPERDLLIDEILEESSPIPGEPGAKSDDAKDNSRLSVFEDFLEGLDIDDDEPPEDDPGPPEDELPPNLRTLNSMSDLLPITDNASLDTQGLPHSRDAEEAVLGAILINPDAYFEVAEILTPEDFYIIRNRWIWEAFISLHDKRTPIDFLTLIEELNKSGHLAEVGGQAYLTTLQNQTPSSMHAEAYAESVAQFAIRRRMLTSANQLAQLAYNNERPVDTILNDAEKSIFGLSERRIKHDVQPIHTVLSSFYNQIEERSRRDEEIFGVPTGLIDLDRLLGGLQKSDLLIIAGRPGSGKTGFLLSVAKNAAQKHKKHVAIFSLEMSNEQLVQRLIAQETGIDTQKLRSGKLEEDDWTKFTNAISVLEETQIFLDDTPAITPLQLRTKCRRLHLEHQLDLVIVDYIQLMSGDIRTENRVQEVSSISRNLKVLARELNVPVLAAAQLSRAVEQREGKRPVLSDLRESGSLEQDSDIVMFIHRPDLLEKDVELANKAEIIIAKHRNGPTHSGIDLVFRNNLTQFDNAYPMR